MTFTEKQLESLQRLIDTGYINQQFHPVLPLTILTYSKKTEREEYWLYPTLISRGLVVDKKGRVVIRCIPKFFNHDQPDAARIDFSDPNTKITVKYDGYLIQIKQDSEYGLIVTSKGSFTSKMVEKAKELLDSNLLKKDWTYVCELCCNFPGDEGTIVTRWNGAKLVCFAVFDENQNEISLSEAEIPKCFEKAQSFTQDEAMEYLSRQDVEGVVLYNAGERVKWKTPHFLQMHRLISHINKRRVLELLSQGESVEELDLPDEFLQQMLDWQKEMQQTIANFNASVRGYLKAYEGKSLKEIALATDIPMPYKQAMFCHLRGKGYTQIVYDMIEEQIRKENRDGQQFYNNVG